MKALRPDFPRAKAGDFYGDWRCVEDDPVTGEAEWVWFETDVHGNVERIHIKRIQHHGPQIIENNKRLLNESANQRWGDGKIAARIPENIFWGELGEAFRQKDDAYIKRFLNDSDNRAFRTFEGNL